MDRRTILAIVLIFTLTIVWSRLSRQWYGEPEANVAPDSTMIDEAVPAEPSDDPQVEVPTTTQRDVEPPAIDTAMETTSGAFRAADIVTVSATSDLMRAEFSTRGGVLTSWRCLEYPGPVDGSVELVPQRDEFAGGITGDELIFSRRSLPVGDIVFSPVGYGDLTVGEAGDRIELLAETDDGVRLRKIMIFAPGSYAFETRYELDFVDGRARTDFFNAYGEPVSVRFVWDRGIAVTEAEGEAGFARRMDTERSFAMIGEELHFLKQKDLPKGGEKAGGAYRGSVRFAGLQNKYFINLGFIPEAATNVVEGRVRLGGDPETLHQSWEIELPLRESGGVPGAALSRYLGPSEYQRLQTHGSDLEKTVNLGWKWIQPVSELMLKIMNWLHRFIPNYGWVIVVISILSKLVFYPLTARGTRAMKKMQDSQARLKPKMDALKKKCGNDSQRYNQELMQLYREEGVNPMAGMAGCMPMLIQMPVFIALYQVLYNMVDLRQTPFIFWIDDLSRPDALFMLPFALPLLGASFNLLPIIMALATWAQTKLTPQTGAGNQLAAMNTIMPIMMLFFLYNMPSGLVIYWTINTALTAFQSWTVNRSAPKAQGAEA